MVSPVLDLRGRRQRGGAELPKVGRDLPIRGRTLSFALRLKNKNSGTNQTHTAKNAATSINVGPALPPAACLNLRDELLYRLAS